MSKSKTLKPVHCEPLHAYHKAGRGLRDGRRYWQIMYHEGGESLSVPGASGWYTRAEVAREMGRRVADGTFGQQVPDGTMEGLLDAWLAHCERVSTSRNTLRSQLASADRLTAAIGAVRVDRVTDSLLLDARRTMAKKYADSTLDLTFNHLGSAWKWARGSGLAPDAPLVMPKGPPKRKRQPVYNRYTPTRAEVEATLVHMSRDWRLLVVEVLFATGARVGEVLTLGWDGFVLGERPALLVGARTKTGSRRVPLNSTVADLLRTAKASANGCRYWHGHETPTQKQLLCTIGAACEAAGVPRWTAHGLRRLAVTEMCLAGVPVHVCARIVGNSAQMVMEVYAQVRAENAEDAVAVLGRGSVEESGKVISIRRGKG